MLILSAWSVFFAWNAPALEISFAAHDRVVFDPSKGESVRVRFMLSTPAVATLKIFDAKDRLVRAISSEERMSAGEQILSWDGRDQAGRVVPSEAYVYVLEAISEANERVFLDLTDVTGGEQIRVEDLAWDATKNEFSYRLREPARVRIRIGLQGGGPHLRTLLDWVPRDAGVRHAAWDGLDTSKVQNFARHPGLKFSGEAVSLSRNTIIVVPENDDVQLIDSMEWGGEKRSRKDSKTRGSTRQIDQRLDIRIELTGVEATSYAETGVPIITGKTPIKLSVHPDDRERTINNRFEVGYFLDGQFLFENEVAFLPTSWLFDPSSVNEGLHFITANLWTYDGNIGTSSIKVFVKKNAKQGAE